jgi:signal-transduction protein with cAMP-binding, CBS, and nucleotidyltransferase domain
MKIIEIPEFKDKKTLLMLEPKMSVMEAVQKMKSYNYGAAIVTENNKLCGIFTERDIMMKIVAEGKDYKTMTIGEVMTKDVQTANAEDEVYDAMRRMTKGRFRHLPIVNNEGTVTGMISQGDFVAITWSQLFHQFKSRTVASLLTNTQIWLLIITIFTYISVMYMVINSK